MSRKFDIILGMNSSDVHSLCTQIYNFLEKHKFQTYGYVNQRLYSYSNVGIDVVAPTDLYDWNAFLRANDNAFKNQGLNYTDYIIPPPYQQYEPPPLIKCTCGTSITMGVEDHIQFHTDYCDLVLNATKRS